MPTKMNEFREDFTAKVIEMLEKGSAPWQKPWDGTGIEALPYNPTTDKKYRGINRLALMMPGYADPRWMTYKQAQEQGWQVRKGEKGTPIEYWKFYDERNATDDAGKPLPGHDGQPRKVRAELERPRVFYATVFNASQMDGIPPLERTGRVYEWKPEDHAESILRGSGARIFHDQADRAFYSRLSDEIHLPLKDQFKDGGAYYSTALHELGHWTGHESRLQREFGVMGNELYAREELRAEIASWLMADAIGITHDPGQHAAYLESWLKALKNDKNEIFHAMADAEKIQEFVLGCSQEQTLEIQEALANARENGTNTREATADALIERIADAPDTYDINSATIAALVDDCRRFVQENGNPNAAREGIIYRIAYDREAWDESVEQARKLLGRSTERQNSLEDDRDQTLDNGERENADKELVEAAMYGVPEKLPAVTDDQRSALTQFIIRGGELDQFVHMTRLTADEFSTMLDEQSRDPFVVNNTFSHQLEMMANHYTESMKDPRYYALNSPDPLTTGDKDLTEQFMQSVFESHSTETGKRLVNDLIKNLQPGEERHENIKGVFDFGVSKSTYDGSINFQFGPRPGHEGELAEMLRTAAAQTHTRANANHNGREVTQERKTPLERVTSRATRQIAAELGR